MFISISTVGHPTRIFESNLLISLLRMSGRAAQLFFKHRNYFLRGKYPKSLTRSISSLPNADLREPSSAELIRSILTVSTGSTIQSDNNANLRKGNLQLLDAGWDLGSPPPALWYALKGLYPLNREAGTKRLHSATDLSSLKHFTERLLNSPEGASRLQRNGCKSLWTVLLRCQKQNTYSEIVSVMTDIIARLERLKVPISLPLLELGMYYAALSLSITTLENFFDRHQRLGDGQLDPEAGSRVVRALLAAVESVDFEDKSFNRNLLLFNVTGEGGLSSLSPKWHTAFHRAVHDDNNLLASYLCLLSTLRSNSTLERSWDRLLGNLDFENEVDCHYAYNVVLSLAQSQRSAKAAAFLDDISVRNHDDLPNIATFKKLKELLDYPVVCAALRELVSDDSYRSVVENCLDNIEQRLGIRWQDVHNIPGRKAHFSVTSNSHWEVFEGKPLMTIDGDCAGYDDISRLYPEIEANGCSKSPFHLAQIVELLHEHDGHSQYVDIHPGRTIISSASSADFSHLDFQWCVQHSPLELRDTQTPVLTNINHQWTPASLGLLRARPIANGQPQLGVRCLHLMQLGSLNMRCGKDNPWHPSGYIVAWDRQYGGMIALFVGTSTSIFDPGLAPVDGPFGAAMDIRLSDVPIARPLDYCLDCRDLTGPYFLDIDPSPDLSF